MKHTQGFEPLLSDLYPDAEEQLGQDIQKRTDRTGQTEQDRQNKTAMTGLPGHEPGQNCQDMAAWIGLPAQDCKEKTTRSEQKGEDNRKEQACEAATL